ncbi:GH25 family lysozyme, partial [Vagococcus elongatus]
VTGEALYTTSDGEQHYNFQLGDRYYWANSKAFQQAITITKMESARVWLEFLGNEYNLYDNPGSLREANELLIGSAYKGTVVTGEALYTTSDGEQHYNFQLGDRYYWANSKAFQQAITITKMEPARVQLEFLGNEHNLYDNPGSLHEANELLIGSAHKGTVVTGEALYTTSDGEQHYNFKFGDRYYWMNSKGLEKVITITKQESVSTELQIVNGNYDMYNTPQNLKNAMKLEASSAHLQDRIRGTALYTLSDGSRHYNFQLGSRYYWINEKGVTKSTYSRPSAKADFIDVSNHQGDLSQSFYNGLSSQGIQGVVLKVSEGTGFFDKYAKNNYQRARNAGLVTGAYHFARYHSANGAIAEANYFDSKLKAINFDKGSNGYVVLDIEHGIAANAANQTAMANAFINRLRQLGYKNVDMYVGDYYLKSNLHASALAVSNPWIAGYPGTADQSVSSITHTGGMGAWQFTDRYPVGSYRLDASVDYSGKYTGVSSGSYLSGVKMNDFKMIQKDGPIFSRPGAFAHNKVVGNLSTYINRNVQVVSKVVTSDGVYYELVHGNGSIGYVKESNL